MNKRFLQNYYGISLMEVLVVIGIISIISLAVTSLITGQVKELKAINEKITLNNIETQLKNAIAKKEFCDCLFQGKTINLDLPTPNWNTPFLINIPNSYTVSPTPPSTCSSSVSLLVPASGSVFDNSYIKNAGIQMSNIHNPGGGNYFTGDLTVTIDPTSLIRPLRAITVPMSFTIDLTTGTSNNRNFLYCGQGIPPSSPAPSSPPGFIFLNTPITVSTTGDGSGNAGWRTYNISGLPAGTSTLIIETVLTNNWRVASAMAMYRKNSSSNQLWLGRSVDDDSRGETAGQGLYPIDTTSNSFDYQISLGGDGGTWTIKIIGYIAP